MPFLWIIFSYLLGSLPFGYLIARASGKNILEIGWKKTSGSNVFKNVGWWQGVLTGILDLAKGYLAVWGSQKLGLPLQFQALAGVAAITGHNWSIFLKFSGGRGIGTFAGCLLAFSPLICGWSLIPLIVLALIWNASIGTILFLTAAIYLSFYYKFESVGLFSFISLAPIFIKRLSPIKEIPKAKNSLKLFFNRLIFDNDEAALGLRIKKIFKKTPGKKPFILNTLLFFPPKITWKAAKAGAKYGANGVKYGIKVAAKPIPVKKIIANGVQMFLSPEKIVTEINKDQIRKMMIAAAKKIVLHQDEINKINVWPVADKDTGYNLAATLLGIEGAISQKEYNSVSDLAQDIKEGAMMNARGNAGMIFTGYLIRFLDHLKHQKTIDALHFAAAMRKGTKAAFRSILNPTQGTILDVMVAAGRKAYEMAKQKRETNLIKILEEAQQASQKALLETKEKLDVLKQNDVVDAGALGFVKILEAWLESLKGITPTAEPSQVLVEKLPAEIEKKLEYRYDLVFSIKKSEKEINLENFKKEFSYLADSIDLVEIEDKIKFHLHTNSPEKIKEKIKDFEILEWRVEDMAVQVRKIVKKKPLGLIVGESADLPREFLEKNQIIEVPFFAKFPDGEILKKENLFMKIREAVKDNRPLPTTSAPHFQEFLSSYQKALEVYDEALALTISSKLSGAYSSARIARSMLENKQRLMVFDCFTAEVGEGLAAMKAQELISQGKNKAEIIEFLKDFCPRIKLIGGLKDFKHIARSGRLPLTKISAGMLSFFSKIGICFLFGVFRGKVRFLGVRFGRDLVKILVQEISREIKKTGAKEIKLALAYGDNLEEALELKNRLEKKEKIKILFLSQVSSVVGVYTGPEVLIVGFSPDE